MSLPSLTPLTPTVRYFVTGTRKWAWVPTIATKTAPTLTELNAGTDLSGEIVASGINGFVLTQALIDAPDAGSEIVSQTLGRVSLGTSSIDFYTSATGSDVRSLLTYKLTGFVVIFTEGIVSGGKMDVWPVTVMYQGLSEDTEKDGEVMIPFAISSKPALGVAIPTS